MIRLLIMIALALALDFLTGVFSAPSIVATMVASRAMSLRRALLISTLAELIGPFLFGMAVANTLALEVVHLDGMSLSILCAALLSALVWTVFSWLLHIPSSTSHAQIGGLLGAALAAIGLEAIIMGGVSKILIGLILVAPVGFVIAYLLVRLCYWAARNASPRVNQRFNQGQLFTSIGLGLTIGSNAAQRTVSMITLGLVLGHILPSFEIQAPVILLSAATLALGNLLSGRRMLKVMGGNFYHIRPIHGFSAQFASGLIILGSSLIGGTVSTTHVSGFAVIGAGTAERLSIVRWKVVEHIIRSWFVSLPVTIVLGFVTYRVFLLLGLPR